MNLGLEGRGALVMAASEGLGLASAQALHGEGARVTISARDPDKLARAAATMPGARQVVGDVTVETDLAAMAAAAAPVDILVVNAGGPPPGAYADLSDVDWAAAVELTLMSAVRAARLVLPGMRERRWGRIVVISSVGVKQPVPGLSLSNSIRMAVLGWAKTLASEVGPDGVTVNTVCPGFTQTARADAIIARQAESAGKPAAQIEAEMAAALPLHRLGRPEDVAALVAFLASEPAGYITGTAIQVDGGMTRGYT
jgi:3-oxoacyl-[acyl-carrier protein] reductase